MCKSRQQAEAALERLRVLLAELGLEPKEADNYQKDIVRFSAPVAVRDHGGWAVRRRWWLSRAGPPHRQITNYGWSISLLHRT